MRFNAVAVLFVDDLETFHYQFSGENVSKELSISVSVTATFTSASMTLCLAFLFCFGKEKFDAFSTFTE